MGYTDGKEGTGSLGVGIQRGTDPLAQVRVWNTSFFRQIGPMSFASNNLLKVKAVGLSLVLG